MQGAGDKVYANQGAEDLILLLVKKYTIIGISNYEYLRIENDKGIIDDYSVEYLVFKPFTNCKSDLYYVSKDNYYGQQYILICQEVIK